MTELDISQLTEVVREQSLRVQTAATEIRKVIVGQPALVDRLLIALLCRGHLLVEGVPGLAKTLAIKTFSRVLDLTFSRIQFTPDLLPADLADSEAVDTASLRVMANALLIARFGLDALKITF